MCGIFGVTGHKEASRLAYFGLYAQQHRGQESAGIASYNGKETFSHTGMGLVPDVFTEETLAKTLAGSTAIGHIRYSTTGKPEVRNAQPLVVSMRGTTLCLAHNGNLTNAYTLRKELEEVGTIFKTSSDSEIFVHLIAHALSGRTLEEAVLFATQKVEGAYCLLILNEGKLIAVRDPHGFHPLAIGAIPDTPEAFVFASETCAFDLIGADFVRDVEPGEMIVIDRFATEIQSCKLPRKTIISQCIFELIYFARPDSGVFGEDVFACRKHMGQVLAKEKETHADMVVPFPDSGIYSSLGISQELGIPYEHALIRNHYVGRTFIQPSQSMREFSVRVKLNFVKSVINNKKLVVVDDSIVRGTTVKTRCNKLKELGAKEIHFRVSCPPIKYPCFYGIDFPSPEELVANKYEADELADVLELDSLHYLSLDGLRKCVAKPDNYCYACLNGVYPTSLPVQADKFALEK